METNQAEENLRVIRTLMERAALYRRRLGPIMLVPGVVGKSLGVGGFLAGMDLPFTFVCSWLGAAVVTIVACLLVSRFQAKESGEPLFSPSARRVLSAMTPGLSAGLLLTLPWLGMLRGMPAMGGFGNGTFILSVLILIWMAFYGTALHGAGLFATRGVRMLGLCFILAAAITLFYLLHLSFNGAPPFSLGPVHPGSQLRSGTVDLNLIMAGIFGGFHLISAAYLFATEKRGSTT